ncbi:MAG: DUF3379 domain-containing protein [Pseudomonadota bacterium]|nr:DUF3379 domain-containing protein [Pseudomonadota bacterium]
MNCEQFRSCALYAPDANDPEMSEHARTCPSCASAVARIRQLDETTMEAIQAVSSPALIDRLLMIPDQARPSKRRIYALAASLAACFALAGFGTVQYVEPSDGAGWARLILDHISENPDEFYTARLQPIQEQWDLLAEVQVSASDLGSVRAIRSESCRMKRTHAVHVMVEVGDARGVVFFLPKNVGEAQISTVDRFAVLTTRNDKTIAVVASDKKEAAKILMSLDTI